MSKFLIIIRVVVALVLVSAKSFIMQNYGPSSMQMCLSKTQGQIEWQYASYIAWLWEGQSLAPLRRQKQMSVVPPHPLVVGAMPPLGPTRTLTQIVLCIKSEIYI